MTKLNFIFLCDEARVDEDGKLNVTGIFTDMGSDRLPAKHPSMTLVINVSPSRAGELSLRIDFLSPSGNEVRPSHQRTVHLPQEKKNFQYLLRIENTLLEEQGEYRIPIFVDGELLYEARFKLSVRND